MTQLLQKDYITKRDTLDPMSLMHLAGTVYHKTRLFLVNTHICDLYVCQKFRASCGRRANLAILPPSLEHKLASR